MKCRNPYCRTEIGFLDWILIRRCCVDCWMKGFELPRLEKFMSKPENKEKFEEWKKQRGKNER